MDLHWISARSPLHLCWISNGSPLHFCWESAASPLHLHWIFSASSLHLHWIFSASPLDRCWISTASSIDTRWISTGSPIHLNWISTASSLDLHWICAGSSPIATRSPVSWFWRYETLTGVSCSCRLWGKLNLLVQWNICIFPVGLRWFSGHQLRSRDHLRTGPEVVSLISHQASKRHHFFSPALLSCSVILDFDVNAPRWSALNS